MCKFQRAGLAAVFPDDCMSTVIDGMVVSDLTRLGRDIGSDGFDRGIESFSHTDESWWKGLQKVIGLAALQCSETATTAKTAVIPFDAEDLVLLCQKETDTFNLIWFTKESFRALNPALSPLAEPDLGRRSR